MGVSCINLSSCGCGNSGDPVIKNIVIKEEKVIKVTNIVNPNPNPNEFKISSLQRIRNKSNGSDFLIVKVNYPNCINYEGNKILVFKDLSIKEIKTWKFLDPHFCENHKSPVARFQPNDEGMQMAIKFCESY